MRVVADTNVIVSMLLWGKSLERLFVLVNRRKIVLGFSPSTIDELFRVVGYPKIPKQADKMEKEIGVLLDKLLAASELVYPAEKLSLVPGDDSDNRILEIAIEARAEYIISGDRHLLDLGSVKGIPIVKPSEFLLGEMGT